MCESGVADSTFISPKVSRSLEPVRGLTTISEFISNGPVVFVYLFLFFGALSRSQATYWLGRYMGHFVMTRGRPTGGWRLKLYRRIHSDSTQHAVEIVRLRGWPMVPLSFLTVGFQSLIQISAGLIRMTWGRYTAASIPGCLVWALIYTTIGWAVWQAAIRAATGSPYMLVGAAILVAVFVLWRRNRRRSCVTCNAD